MDEDKSTEDAPGVDWDRVDGIVAKFDALFAKMLPDMENQEEGERLWKDVKYHLGKAKELGE